MKQMKNKYDDLNNYIISLLQNVTNFNDLCFQIHTELPELVDMKFVTVFVFSNNQFVTSVYIYIIIIKLVKFKDMVILNK